MKQRRTGQQLTGQQYAWQVQFKSAQGSSVICWIPNEQGHILLLKGIFA